MGLISYPRTQGHKAPLYYKDKQGTCYLPKSASHVNILLKYPNWKIKEYHYVKKDRALFVKERNKFDSSVRSNFLKNLVEAHKEALVTAGLKDVELERMGRGKVPLGFQVHHILPLDDNGTNDANNLLLMKNRPYHTSITKLQKSSTFDMQVGEERKIGMIVPSEDMLIWPLLMDTPPSEYLLEEF